MSITNKLLTNCKLIAGAGIFAIFTSTASHAVVISIDTFATGQDAGSAVVATLTLSDNGSGGVDFLMTNSVSNLGAAANASTFISDLGFSYAGASPLTLTQFNVTGGNNQVINQSDFSIAPPGNFQGGYDFYLELGFPTSGRGGGALRFLDGEWVSWTIDSVNLSDFTSRLVTGTGDPALAAVHIQSLASGGSTTYVGDTTPGGGPNVVPAPATALLVVGGLAMFGVGGRRRRRAEK